MGAAALGGVPDAYALSSLLNIGLPRTTVTEIDAGVLIAGDVYPKPTPYASAPISTGQQ
jgi:hypothetical protein